MKTDDRLSSLFWLLLAGYACIGAIRMGVGTLRNPGMGLMPFGVSALLGILSLVVLLRSSKGKESTAERGASRSLWTRVLPILIALVLYAKLMPVVGYLVSTFFLITFLFWVVERNKLRWMLILSFLTTVITYTAFSKWLNLQFPVGFFGP